MVYGKKLRPNLFFPVSLSSSPPLCQRQINIQCKHSVANAILPGGSGSKESAYNVGDLGSVPGTERSRGEGNGTHSSILVWRIPSTEEPGRLQSMELQRVEHI